MNQQLALIEMYYNALAVLEFHIELVEPQIMVNTQKAINFISKDVHQHIKSLIQYDIRVLAVLESHELL